jgi:hypothetical protein
MATSTLRLALALTCSLVLLACSQDRGEPCQRNADCSDGLECSISRGSARGTCEPPRDEEPEADAGEQPDAGGPGIPNEDAAALEMDAGSDDDAG